MKVGKLREQGPLGPCVHEAQMLHLSTAACTSSFLQDTLTLFSNFICQVRVVVVVVTSIGISASIGIIKITIVIVFMTLIIQAVYNHISQGGG